MPLLPSFRLLYEYILSFQTVRFGYQPRDKFKILINRVLYGSYPINLLWTQKFEKPFIDPRVFVHDYRCGYRNLVFYCAGGNSEIQFLGRYEPSVKSIISRLDGGDAVDVGANIGLYTMMLSRVLADRGTVLSLEPDPHYFRLLQRNVRINRGLNVALLDIAAWSENEELKLVRYRPGSSPIDTSVSPTDHATARTVRGRPLDELIRESGIRPRLVKIDVEGAEYRVLSGMETILRSVRPIVIFEALTTQALAKCNPILHSAHYHVKALPDGNFLAAPEFEATPEITPLNEPSARQVHSPHTHEGRKLHRDRRFQSYDQ